MNCNDMNCNDLSHFRLGPRPETLEEFNVRVDEAVDRIKESLSRKEVKEMVDRVRGKFFVLGFEKPNGINSPGTKIKLGAVSASDPEKTENCMYHKYTPSGSIEMWVDNPEAEQFFVLGQEIYVDFTKAPVEKKAV